VISDRIEKKFLLVEAKAGNKDNVSKAIIDWLKTPELKVEKAIITTQKLFKIREEAGKKIFFVPYVGIEKLFR